MKRCLLASLLFIVAGITTGWAQSFLSPITLQNVPSSLQATSLTFGPDQRLYVLDLKGDVYIFTISRYIDGPDIEYAVISTEHITLVRNIQNYNDDATLHNTTKREATGIMVTGTASDPVIYVASSDHRVGDFPDYDTGLDTNSGTISRLKKEDGEWKKVDIVRGLPRSEENHATNGLLLDTTSNMLYVAQGGNTNAGLPYFLFGYTNEYALSSAILTVDLDSIEAMPILTDSISGDQYIYNLPTLDDPTRDNANGINDPMAPGYDGIDIYDPFGGNDGLNQAKLVENGPVQVYSGGYRNPYDVVMTTAGHLYTWDNGGNATWGGMPADTGYGKATNRYEYDSGPYMANRDRLHRIDSSGYFGGHPNPIRSNPDSAGLYTLNPSGTGWRTEYDTTDPSAGLPYDWPPVDSALRRPQEGLFFQAGDPLDASQYWNQESTNGLAEYTATNFDSAMTGDLIAAGWGSHIFWVQLDSSGSVDTVITIAGIAGALDVACPSDDQAYAGTIWVGVLTAGFVGRVRILEPTDLDSCSGNYFYNIDEDLDGYTNADEIDNATNPCLGSFGPRDHDGTYIDGFLVSDLNDPDDDDDGQSDSTDYFAWDPFNGLTKDIPFTMSLADGGDEDSSFLGMGFTGFMSNGSSDYLELYKNEDNSDVQIIPGGAAGVLTFIGVDTGDARGTLNSQANGLQVGFSVDSTTLPFVAQLRVLGPVFPDSIEDFQSVGGFLGTGDQDNYIRIACIANDSTPAIEVLRESAGIVTADVYTVDSLNNAQAIDLIFAVNPANGMVFPYYSLDTGDIIALGDGFMVEGDFLDALKGDDAIAIGVIASARGSVSRFDASWDRIKVDFDPVSQGIELPGEWVTLSTGTGCAAEGNPGSCCTARHECAYIQAGDKFYLLGGREANSLVEIYDPLTDTWTSGATPPVTPLHHFQGVEYHGLIIAAGAFDVGTYPNEQPSDSIYVYDPLSDTWFEGPAGPSGRLRGAAGAFIQDDALILVGGNTDGHNDGAVNWVDKFDFNSNKWDTLPDAPRARDHFHLARLGGDIYAAAGRRSGEGGGLGTLEPIVDLFDINSESWSSLSSNLPTTRAGAATVTLGNDLVVIGGEVSSGALAEKTTEAYNIETESWRTLDEMNYNRHGAQAIVNNAAIYTAAGAFISNIATNTTEAYYPYGETTPILTPTIQSSLATVDTLVFDPTYMFDSSSTYLTIKNSGGTQALLLHDLALDSNSHFEVDTAMPFPRFLKPGDSIQIPIKFKPVEMGTTIDSIVIGHTGANAPSTTIILAGEGVLTWIGGERMYVDSAASGSQYGTSWDSAVVSLELALSTAKAFTDIREIWIAKGTYYPGDERTSTFEIVDSVQIFGGFAGTEVALGQRDVDTNLVVLSGDIGVPGDSTDNVYHVVTISESVDSSRLDGITIVYGNADGPDPASKVGAGIFNRGKSVIVNMTIRGCSSVLPGSAIYSEGGSAQLDIADLTMAENSDPYLVNKAGSLIRLIGTTIAEKD